MNGVKPSIMLKAAEDGQDAQGYFPLNFELSFGLGMAKTEWLKL